MKQTMQITLLRMDACVHPNPHSDANLYPNPNPNLLPNPNPNLHPNPNPNPNPLLDGCSLLTSDI